MKIRKSWYELLKPEFESDTFKKLQEFLAEENSKYTIYPSEDNIFASINAVAFDDVKVVIIGQDPYHEPGQAHGLSFSVQDGTPFPPSLVNIFKEIEDDLKIKCINSGDLTRWAKQGVLLLNTTLTVRKGQANSHQGKGWDLITGKIVKLLSKREKPVVFMLWGSFAGSFANEIDKQHLVLKSVHPSPLSAYRGFLGCKHFSKCNEFLIKNNQTPIDWQ